VVISVLFSILGLTLGAGLIIDFVSVRDGLIIDFVSVRDGLIIAPTQHYSMFRQAHVAACKSS